MSYIIKLNGGTLAADYDTLDLAIKQGRELFELYIFNDMDSTIQICWLDSFWTGWNSKNKSNSKPLKVVIEFKIWKERNVSRIYTVRIKTDFLLSQKQIKEALGIGYKVLGVEEIDATASIPKVLNTDEMSEAIVKAGYKALARVLHPDLGNDPEAMVVLNRTKTELVELLKSLKSNGSI